VYYSIQNYDLAIRLFTDAINLKPDYANGYYNLAVALRDKGDIQSAQAAAERVVSLVDPQSPDYEVASKFLSDIKEKTATLSAQQTQGSNLTNPNAQNNGALQQQELPDVIDLPQPESVATPEAAPRRGASPTPRATASPAAAN
jgi:tetratricopeptide (TPR) repeat protein